MQSNTMRTRQKQIQRSGKIYRFSIGGTKYAAFVWQEGKQFCGRVEGNPDIPQCTGRTALAVRDALQLGLTPQIALRR